jgi:hypothetical protein
MECVRNIAMKNNIEQQRNNPERPSEHTYSKYCSCGHCHMAYLITEEILKRYELKEKIC